MGGQRDKLIKQIPICDNDNKETILGWSFYLQCEEFVLNKPKFTLCTIFNQQDGEGR